MRLKNIFIFFIIFFFIFPCCILAQTKKSKFFGVLDFLCWNQKWNNYQYPNQKSLKKTAALMKEAGVSIVRMDFLWQDLETKPNEWNYQKYDQIVEILSKNNIEILGVMGYCADWASPRSKWNVLGDDYSKFLNYVQKVTNHYKGKVKYWEVWNEPDSYIYWEDQDGLKSYCDLLGQVYKTIKKECPDCSVLNGGLANGLASVNKIYDNGAKNYFDIFNIHVFNTPKDTNAIKKTIAYVNIVHKIMQRNGDKDKKIWITEIGCPGIKKGVKIDNWWMGPNTDEQEQAQWLSEVYSELFKIESVDKVFWAFWRDTQDYWKNGVDYFGIIRKDFSKKPAFSAFKAAVSHYK